MKKNIILIFSIILLLPAISYCQDTTLVIASTTWTAAYAKAAGAENIVTIAPLQLQHPPEYELKPSDMEKMQNADLVIYAGYERFIDKLLQTAAKQKIDVIKIETLNSPASIKTETKKIAKILGREEHYKNWENRFQEFVKNLIGKIETDYENKKVVVHQFQIPLAQTFGFDIIGEFGPAEPSPAVISDLIQMNPDIVIDNYHNPCGQPIAEGAKAKYVQFINFPGKAGTSTFEDLYQYNYQALGKGVNYAKTAEGKSNKPILTGFISIILIILILIFVARKSY